MWSSTYTHETTTKQKSHNRPEIYFWSENIPEIKWRLEADMWIRGLTILIAPKSKSLSPGINREKMIRDIWAWNKHDPENRIPRFFEAFPLTFPSTSHSPKRAIYFLLAPTEVIFRKIQWTEIVLMPHLTWFHRLDS